VGRTPSRWNRPDNRITIDVSDEQFVISCELINGEMLDSLGRTEADVDKYCEAFEQMNQQAADDIPELMEQLHQRQETTINEVREVEDVMDLYSGSRWLTFSIIVVNVLVFLLMALSGAGIIEPDPTIHIRWGSNFIFYTSTGDYWRLFTNTFLHFGILHLAMNMYALYMVGMFLEPMLGKIRFLAAYVGAGLLASLTSLWWHTDGVNSAGASGAVFGLYGLFLGLLSANLIPELLRKDLLNSTLIFVGYNLLFGSLKGGVDNAAHIGGLFSGLVMTLFYLPGLRREHTGGRQAQWLGITVLALTVGICYYYLKSNQGNMSERKAAEQELYYRGFPDQELFNQKLKEFDQSNTYALATLMSQVTSDNEPTRVLLMSVASYWRRADQALSECLRLRVSEEQLKKAGTLREYVDLRQLELSLIVSIVKEDDFERRSSELRSLRLSAEAKYQEALGYRDGVSTYPPEQSHLAC
jgi:rhomboid protease GluP